MQQRSFGVGGPKVSEVGLGTWQLGGADWGDVSEKDAGEILAAAIDGGVNFLDTADVYGGGLSEERIGRFLSERRLAPGEDIFVATKLGRFAEPGWPENLTPQAMRTHTENSLRRLGVETLDLTQLHCIPPDALENGEVFDTLRTLQQEGKIRRFGASVESMAEAKLCLRQPGLASLQIIFNILRQHPIEAIFEEAAEKGVAVIVRLPLASGLLAGKLNTNSIFSENDHRNYNADGSAFNVGETFAGFGLKNGVTLAEGVRPILPQGVAMAQTAIRWCLDFDAVTTVIPGATKVAQVQSNVAAAGLPQLSPQVHNMLRWYYETEVKSHIRGPI